MAFIKHQRVHFTTWYIRFFWCFPITYNKDWLVTDVVALSSIAIDIELRPRHFYNVTSIACGQKYLGHKNVMLWILNPWANIQRITYESSTKTDNNLMEPSLPFIYEISFTIKMYIFVNFKCKSKHFSSCFSNIQ